MKQILDIINDAGTSIALAQNNRLLNTYTVALTWLREYYLDGGDSKFIAKKYGMSKYSNSLFLEKIKEEALGLNASYDEKLANSLIKGAILKISSLTEDFFEKTKLPKDLSSPGSLLEFNFKEPKLFGDKLIFCYHIKNKVNEMLDISTTLNVVPTILEYIPKSIHRTNKFFLDPLETHQGCAILQRSNLLHGQGLEDYINLSLQVKYSKYAINASVDEIDTKNVAYYFSQDLLEFINNSADLIVSVRNKITASPGDACSLSVHHELPPTGDITYAWNQILTEQSWATVSIANSNSPQAEFVTPDLPPGVVQNSLWFSVTVTSGSGENIQKTVRVLVKPDASAPTLAPTNLSAIELDGSLIFSWDAVPDADYYTLYVSTESGIAPGNYTMFSSYYKASRIYETSYENVELENNKKYYAVVTAIKNLQESSPSSEASIVFGSCFSDNGDGTISDACTALMWQQENDGSLKSWASAGGYCQNLELGGYTDWRLPTKSELKNIVFCSNGPLAPLNDNTQCTGRTGSSNYSTQTIDISFQLQENSPGGWYSWRFWTSTAWGGANNSYYAQYVNFNTGVSGRGTADTSPGHYVHYGNALCVR